ncbi:Uma2 family endonuclease [Leptolyngbya sp. NK1-12]|uniref:Uma2 family endonuclease n=1 Tax=Leptolyngbya sp. NK1-12 TaxID=2547451 RepID=A0AA97AF33_9CYAN|nr:Uma2 family endonuclease [Leptolyngbya sp. NK1-12]WNZ22740.1 Uma2 family endonuclease [Leptolyngbya sp. NK1-12]
MPTQARTYTPEAYLALEETAEFRSEYHNGEIVPMTGGSTNHNELITNLLILLKPILHPQGNRIYSSDVRLWVPRYRRFTYPDVMVIQGAPIYYANRTDTVTNPILIVEVLSKSTQDYSLFQANEVQKMGCRGTAPAWGRSPHTPRTLPEWKKLYDRTDKFRYYRSIPELQEYVLINQYEIQIEQLYQNATGIVAVARL